MSDSDTDTAKELNDFATLQFDGACRGNPGEASYGYVIETPHRTVQVGESIGHTTNNCAEYEALIAGLERAHDLNINEISIRGDSQLVIKQVRGEWDVNDPKMEKRHAQVTSLLEEFEEFDLDHRVREENMRADKLANQALDEQT